VFSGHTRLRRCPFLDRDETRKRDRELRRRKAEEEEELQCKNTWVKYSLGLRHQVTALVLMFLYHNMFVRRNHCIFKIFLLTLRLYRTVLEYRCLYINGLESACDWSL